MCTPPPTLCSSKQLCTSLPLRAPPLASTMHPIPLHWYCFVHPPRLPSPLLSSSPHASCPLAPKSCAACNPRTTNRSELVLFRATCLASQPPALVRALHSASCLFAPVLFAPCSPMPLSWYCFVSPTSPPNPCCCLPPSHKAIVACNPRSPTALDGHPPPPPTPLLSPPTESLSLTSLLTQSPWSGCCCGRA